LALLRLYVRAYQVWVSGVGVGVGVRCGCAPPSHMKVLRAVLVPKHYFL
jgi:hypothetical protein